LWLAGRNAAAIRDSRGVVYPFQVEYALSGTPGVRRAALIARHGRRVLVLETIGRRFRSDCASAARCIAEHQVDSIVTVRRIPMDRRHNAKVDYTALERILEGRMANMRLWLIQTISTSWRYCRRGLRSILYSCKFRKTATKVRR
jgi:hypothetical protein